MQPIDRCSVCGGELITKEVEQRIRGGDDGAIVRAQADVCEQCGERLFAPETIRRFEEMQPTAGPQTLDDLYGELADCPLPEMVDDPIPAESLDEEEFAAMLGIKSPDELAELDAEARRRYPEAFREE